MFGVDMKAIQAVLKCSNFASWVSFTGENRHGHRYWWFTCEKESIFVEREPTRWGRYTKKADIDLLLEALDDRSLI